MWAWVSKARLPMALDDSGHLIEAPDLAVEVLSLGAENLRRDRELKLGLYSVQGRSRILDIGLAAKAGQCVSARPGAA